MKDRKNLKYAIAAAHSDFASNGYTTVKDKNSIEKRYTFEEVYEMWRTDYQYTVKESAYWKTVGIFRNHILPSYGHKIINDITALDCQSVVHRWFETVKDTKKYNIYAIMVFDYAIKKLKLIKENPAKDLSYPKKDNIDETGENYYTREELNYFGECMKKEVKRTNTYKWYTLFRLLAYTGMRKGEAFALTWDDVDLEDKEIKINKTLTRGVGNKIIVQSPKTMRSKRIVTIDEETVVALKRLKAEMKSTNIILGTKRSNLVFPNTKNTWTDPNQSNTKLDMIIKRYNLKKLPRMDLDIRTLLYYS